MRRVSIPLIRGEDHPHADVDSALGAVLFTDLVGSTPIRQRLGDERYSYFQNCHLAMLEDAFHAEKGAVLKLEGDGMMAVFRSAKHALRAAAGIQARVERQRRHPLRPAEMNVRMGIAAGDVSLTTDDAEGLPIVQASRLCDQAEGGQVLCNELLNLLVAGGREFSFGEPSQLPLKGLDEPLTVMDLEWWKHDALFHCFPESLLDHSGFEFAGRSSSLDHLRTAWARCQTGNLAYIEILGEAGSGKSRLASEAALEAFAIGAEVWAGRCEQYHGLPYQPFADALGQHLQLHGSLTHNKTLDARLARLLTQSQREQLGLPPPEPLASQAGVAQLHEAVIAWLTKATDDRPVVFVVDDLVWADDGTLNLLAQTLEAAPTMRLLIISTSRNEGADLHERESLHEARGRLARRAAMPGLRLEGLSVDETLEMMGGAVESSVRAADDSFAEHLQTLTEGNPFFMVDTIGWLHQQGLLNEALRGSWPQMSSAGVSEGVAAVAEQRLLLVDPAGRDVIRCAALRGLTFEAAVVSTAAGRGADGSSMLAQARDAGIIEENDESEFPAYRFRHDLVRESLLRHSTSSQLRSMHLRLGEAIESVHRQDLDRYAAAAASHLEASEDRDARRRAVTLYQLGAEHALRQAAPATAHQLLVAAGELAAITPLGPADRAELLYRQGRVAKRSGQHGARRQLLEAGKLAYEANDRAIVIAAAIANSRGLFSMVGRVDDEVVQQLRQALDTVEPGEDVERSCLMAGLSQELTFAEDREQANTMSEEALALAMKTEDDRATLRAVNARHSVLWHPAGLHERLQLIDQWSVVARRVDDAGWEASAMSFGVPAALESGDLDLARRRLARLDELGALLNQPPLNAYQMLWTGLIATIDGDLELAEQMAIGAREINRAAGNQDGEAWYLGQMYPVRWHQGRLAELEEDFAVAYAFVPDLPVLGAALANIRAEMGQPEGLAELIRVPLESVETQRAHVDQLVTVSCLVRTVSYLDDAELAARLIPLLTPYEEQYICNGTVHFGSPHHYLGMLHTVTGDRRAANESFRVAVEHNAALGGPALLARTRVEWAKSLLSGDRVDGADRDCARELVRQAIDAAGAFGLTGIERDAGRVLGDLDGERSEL